MEKSNKNEIGAFISGALVATAIAGYALFVSKDAKDNRDRVEDWVDDAKAEALSKIKKVKRLSRRKYDEIIDTVSDKYSKIKEVGQNKADEFCEELKSRWDEIEKEEKNRINDSVN